MVIPGVIAMMPILVEIFLSGYQPKILQILFCLLSMAI